MDQSQRARVLLGVAAVERDGRRAGAEDLGPSRIDRRRVAREVFANLFDGSGIDAEVREIAALSIPNLNWKVPVVGESETTRPSSALPCD